MAADRANLDQTHYDVLLIGTDLPTAILGAALSHAGFSSLHVDPREYYGSDWASLTLQELQQWSREYSTSSDARPHASISFPYFESGHSDAELTPTLPAPLQRQDRHFSIALTPTLLGSRGHAIDTLVKSNVAQYSTFRLLELTALALGTGTQDNALRRVPSSKEDVFKDRSLSLIEKRKLMKFLQHASQLVTQTGSDPEDIEQNFSADPELVPDEPFDTYLRTKFGFPDALMAPLVYGIAMAPWCGTDDSDSESGLGLFPSMSARQGVSRVACHLASIGRYGNSAHLVGQYGGAGELAQGYARSAAVKGTVFMLGTQIELLQRVDDRQARDPDTSQSSPQQGPGWQAQLSSVQGLITADWVVGPPTLFPALEAESNAAPAFAQGSIARGIMLLDRPVDYNGLLAAGAAETPTPTAPATRVNEQESTAPKTYETAMLVFPPKSQGQSACQVLAMGEGTFSCPKGTYLYYLSQYLPDSSDHSAEHLLRPYVNQLLHWASGSAAEWTPQAVVSPTEPKDEPISTPQDPIPLFQCFYSQPSVPQAVDPRLITERFVPMTFPPSVPLASRSPQSVPPSLAEMTDLASQVAEESFWLMLGHAEVASSEPFRADPVQVCKAGQALKVRAQQKAQWRAKTWEGRDPTEFQGRAGVREGPEEGLPSEAQFNWDEVVEFFPPQRQQED